jgi:hypothetical protein
MANDALGLGFAGVIKDVLEKNKHIEDPIETPIVLADDTQVLIPLGNGRYLCTTKESYYEHKQYEKQLLQSITDHIDKRFEELEKAMLEQK